jgi:TonB-dependent SusC/RagA subfamily outer membrane receptor
VQGPTNPLILIDGVPGGLQTVAAEDIETISVLKDGSAAAMYGSRASNGVILITTKRHQGGAPTLRYDGYVGQSTINNSPDFLTARDYRRLIGEGYGFEDLGFETNWQDQVTRQPVSYRHNLSLSGGAFNTNYTASVNLENEEGIFNRSDNNEITARANIRHQMFDGKLEAEANLVSRTQKNFTGPDFNYAWRQAMIRNPTDRVREDNGVWQERTGYFYVNPGQPVAPAARAAEGMWSGTRSQPASARASRSMTARASCSLLWPSRSARRRNQSINSSSRLRISICATGTRSAAR